MSACYNFKDSSLHLALSTPGASVGLTDTPALKLMTASSHLPWGAHLGKKKSPSSLILNHSVALATHWMKPWAWKEGLFHYSGICAGKRKHVIRMSCLRFALLPSSMRRWEACKQKKGRVSKSSYSFGRKRATWFLKQMTQKRSRMKRWDSGRAVPRNRSKVERWKHGPSFTFTSLNY